MEASLAPHRVDVFRLCSGHRDICVFKNEQSIRLDVCAEDSSPGLSDAVAEQEGAV